MSESKHTPGPWIAWYIADEFESRVRDEDGVLICKCYWPDEHRNAKLIAAAPELLAALEVAVEYFDRNDIDCIAHDDAKAAIKKAKGE